MLLAALLLCYTFAFEFMPLFLWLYLVHAVNNDFHVLLRSQHWFFMFCWYYVVVNCFFRLPFCFFLVFWEAGREGFKVTNISSFLMCMRNLHLLEFHEYTQKNDANCVMFAEIKNSCKLGWNISTVGKYLHIMWMKNIMKPRACMKWIEFTKQIALLCHGHQNNLNILMGVHGNNSRILLTNENKKCPILSDVSMIS